MSLNSIGRDIPDSHVGSRLLYQGPWARTPEGLRHAPPLGSIRPGDSKIIPSLREAIAASGLRDGMTVSFHHHLRNGDHVLNMVMEVIAGMGIRDLTVAPSSLFPVHGPLVDHIRKGVVRGLQTNYALGDPAAEADPHRQGTGQPCTTDQHHGTDRLRNAEHHRYQLLVHGGLLQLGPSPRGMLRR